MKAIVAVLALFVMTGSAFANPWEVGGGYAGWWDGDGDGNWRVDGGYAPYRQDRGYRGHPTLFGGYEEEIWDGNCKIERKWEDDGDYREANATVTEDLHALRRPAP